MESLNIIKSVFLVSGLLIITNCYSQQIFDQNVVVRQNPAILDVTSTVGTSSCLNLKNTGNTFWHLTGPRSYETKNPFGIFYYNGTSYSRFLQINSDGNVAIGGTDMIDKLNVNSGILRITGTDVFTDPGLPGLRIGANSTLYNWIQSTQAPLLLNPLDAPTETTENKYFVGIGFNPATSTFKVPTGYRLAVKGNIICHELKVQPSSTWTFPDYVFEKEYKLLPLKEVETFVNEHKHLPEIPSAAQVNESGLNIGDMNALLLKKVEELTLYLIEQNKQIEQLKESNIILKERLNVLENK